MDRVLTKLNNSKGETRNSEVMSWIIRTVQLKWNNTLRAEVIMGTNPRGSQSSDGIIEQAKRGTKEAWRGQQNKELNTGKRTGVNSYKMRPEGDIIKVAQIGNQIGIGNLSGINWEQRQLFDHEDKRYAGAERRWD